MSSESEQESGPIVEEKDVDFQLTVRTTEASSTHGEVKFGRLFEILLNQVQRYIWPCSRGNLYKNDMPNYPPVIESARGNHQFQ